MTVTTLPAGTTTSNSEIEVLAADELRMDPALNTTLVMNNKNLIIRGRLNVKPNPGVQHLIQFINVNENAYVGGAIGGMSGTPVASDVGLWVVDAGVADIQGTPKAGWNRSGDDATWNVGDEMFKTPWNQFDYTTYAAHLKGGALASLVGIDGVTYTQECFNLTRNARIEGTAGHQAHAIFRTDVPQTIKYASFRFMGPRKDQTGDGYTDKIRGRWGVHLHHLGDAGYDSLIEGVVVRDCGSHAFVSHGTHGTPFVDCIAFNCNETAYWWDFDVVSDRSHDVLYDHCMAAKIVPIPAFRGSSELSGFLLAQTTGIARDCVAVGNLGSLGPDSSGFGWPSGDPAGPGMSGIWVFEDNIAHNNKQSGLFFWLNTSGDLHTIKRYVGFRNGAFGIKAGAYVNGVHWEDSVMFQNGNNLGVFANNAKSTNPADGSPHQLIFRNNISSMAYFGDHVLPPGSGGPGLLFDGDYALGRVDERNPSAPAQPGKYDLINCGLEPADWTVLFMHASSVYRVQRPDGTAYRVNANGTTTVIPTFALFVTTTSLSQATQGAAYSQSLSKVFGLAPVTWRLKTGSGPLPPGISLSSAGVISGTPTSSGTFPITVEAVDANGVNSSKLLSLFVAATANLQITTSSLPGGIVDTAYSQSLAATGGVPPRTFSLLSGSLPPGLSVSTAGLISGTPTAGGSYLPTFRVTDSASATAQREIGIDVVNLNPAFVTTDLSPGEETRAHSQTLQAQDGAPPYTFSVAIGPLPPGLGLSPAGVLSGTPTTLGDYPVRLRVTDSAGRFALRDYSITIYAALNLPTPSLPAAVVGQPYSAAVPVIGGAPPIVFDTQPVPGFPPGLQMSVGGIISGTPTVAGSFSFGIGVVDQLAVADSTTGSIEVSALVPADQTGREHPRAFVLRHPNGGSRVRDMVS